MVDHPQPSLMDSLPPLELIGQVALLAIGCALVVICYRGRYQIVAIVRAGITFGRAVVARYVTLQTETDSADDRPFTASNSPEHPLFVQVEQLNAAAEQATIEAAGRFLAAHNGSEAALIELLFDGVKRGGGARYLALRDAVRVAAQRHGWKAPQAPAPDAPRQTPVAGRDIPEGLQFAGQVKK